MGQWDRFLTKAASAGHADAIRDVHLTRARRAAVHAELVDVAPVHGAHVVLNLDRSRDRLKAFRRASASCGFEPARQRAVDAAAPDYSVEDQLDGFPDGPVREFAKRNPGGIACFAGHRAMWRRILDEDLPLAALYEDDAVPLADPLRYLAKYPPPEGWDVINFSERVEPLDAFEEPYVQIGSAVRSHFKHAKSLSFHHPPGNDGYLVSARGAKRLLEIIAAVGLPAALDYTLVRNGMEAPLTTGYERLDSYYNGRHAQRLYVAPGRKFQVYATRVALSELSATPSLLSPIRKKGRRAATRNAGETA